MEKYQARRINQFSNFLDLLHSQQTVYRKANILRGMRNVKQDSDGIIKKSHQEMNKTLGTHQSVLKGKQYCSRN
jgi:hypothetical protein